MDRSAVEDEIRTAFHGVLLGDGMSLGQARISDRFGEGFSDEELAKLIPQNEIKSDWSEISPDQLDNDLCIGHIDAEAFRYYIPALMLSVLNRYSPLDERVSSTFFALDQGPSGGGRSWYTMLTEAQCRAIAHFLQSLPALLPLKRHDAETVSRALRDHWNRYL